MAQKEIELILSRQFADSLDTPIFITDTLGNLLFYNVPSEKILGLKYKHTGPMPVEEWSTVFKPVDAIGNPLAPEKLPLVISIRDKKPAQADFWIEGLDGTRRYLSVTSFPIIGRGHRFLGAIAIFWENVEE
jgi:PAS domain-containing protein